MSVTTDDIKAELKAIYTSPWTYLFVAIGIATAFYTQSFAFGVVMTAACSGVWIMNSGPISGRST